MNTIVNFNIKEKPQRYLIVKKVFCQGLSRERQEGVRKQCNEFVASNICFYHASGLSTDLLSF